MRIIAGSLRSRKLIAPEGAKTRPTSDRARESLFNVLSHMRDLEGASVLDLFAGSGALGFESLSRGARHCTFVEQDLAARRIIEQNASALGVQASTALVKQEVLTFLSRPNGAYDLVFADPPYDDVSLCERAIERLAKGWLATGGLLVVEHRTGKTPVVSQAWKLIRTLTAGEASFLFLKDPGNE